MSEDTIAWSQGYIDDTQLQKLAHNLGKSGYGEYLISLMTHRVLNFV